MERRFMFPPGGQEEAPRVKRGGGLHPARPDWWPPTKRPWATTGGLMAASVTYLSRQEGVPACLRTSPPFGGTIGCSPDFLAYPFLKACQRRGLGTGVPRCLGVARSNSSPKAAQALGCSLTPRLRVWPGDLHGTCCLSARAMNTVFPTVVWDMRLVLGFAIPWLLLI